MAAPLGEHDPVEMSTANLGMGLGLSTVRVAAAVATEARAKAARAAERRAKAARSNAAWDEAAEKLTTATRGASGRGSESGGNSGDADGGGSSIARAGGAECEAASSCLRALASAGSTSKKRPASAMAPPQQITPPQQMTAAAANGSCQANAEQARMGSRELPIELSSDEDEVARPSGATPLLAHQPSAKPSAPRSAPPIPSIPPIPPIPRVAFWPALKFGAQLVPALCCAEVVLATQTTSWDCGYANVAALLQTLRRCGWAAPAGVASAGDARVRSAFL